MQNDTAVGVDCSWYGRRFLSPEATFPLDCSRRRLHMCEQHISPDAHNFLSAHCTYINTCAWLKFKMCVNFVSTKKSSSLVVIMALLGIDERTLFVLVHRPSFSPDLFFDFGTEPISRCRSAQRGVWPNGRLDLKHRL